jgi:hypothetical protein
LQDDLPQTTASYRLSGLTPCTLQAQSLSVGVCFDFFEIVRDVENARNFRQRLLDRILNRSIGVVPMGGFLFWGG